MLPSRRGFIAGLIALTACRPKDAVVWTPPDTEQIVLGWRWVPGASHRWRTVLERTTRRVAVQRAEEWTYLVREVDDHGIATLEGRLTGLGAGVDVDDTPLDDQLLDGPLLAEQDSSAPVTLYMGIDGRLAGLETTEFARALPHHLLAQYLAPRPVARGEPWPDTALPRAVGRLLPQDAEVRTRGETRLVALGSDDGHPTATLSTSGHARVTDGPILRISGETQWDTHLGLPRRREIELSTTVDDGDAVRDPGTLRLQLEYMAG